MHNQPREQQPWEACQVKLIQEFGWTSQGMDWGLGSRHQEPPHTDVSGNLATVVVFLLLTHSWTTDNIRGILPGLRRRRTGLLPSGPKSSFQMRASFLFHLETKVLESGVRVEELITQVAWSPVLGFHSLMIWGAMSSAGVGPLWFFENQSHCTRLPRHFRALHASFCWAAFWRCLSPFLVKFTQILESILLDKPLKAAVLSVGCASFSSTLFPSTQLSVNMLGHSTLWTASFFGNEFLWLTFLVKGANDCCSDSCPEDSPPHDCVAEWTKLRDHFEGSGNLCRCWVD